MIMEHSENTRAGYKRLIIIMIFRSYFPWLLGKVQPVSVSL